MDKVNNEDSLLSPGYQERINRLRQIKIDRSFTPDEMEEFKFLTEKEKKAKGIIETTEEEKGELSELRKIQMYRDFKPEEKERFLYLQSKEEGKNNKSEDLGEEGENDQMVA